MSWLDFQTDFSTRKLFQIARIGYATDIFYMKKSTFFAKKNWAHDHIYEMCFSQQKIGTCFFEEKNSDSLPE